MSELRKLIHVSGTLTVDEATEACRRLLLRLHPFLPADPNREYWSEADCRQIALSLLHPFFWRLV